MLERLLITGAAGGIAQLVQGQLGSIAHSLRLSDIRPPQEMPEGAEFVHCDLADRAGVAELVKGCDGILHLGGISTENSFERILDANIIGTRNLYDAAQLHGQPRIFLASSNHVVGFYAQHDHLDTAAAHRPDSWYGVSKSFGEATALMFFHKFGQESALVRIGSCFSEPKDHRMLATWLAPEDFVSLVARVFDAPHLGCPVIYAVSDNDARWWNNDAVAYLGWKPQHNSAAFADRMRQTVPLPDPRDPVAIYQGGAFAAAPLMEE